MSVTVVIDFIRIQWLVFFYFSPFWLCPTSDQFTVLPSFSMLIQSGYILWWISSMELIIHSLQQYPTISPLLNQLTAAPSFATYVHSGPFVCYISTQLICNLLHQNTVTIFLFLLRRYTVILSFARWVYYNPFLYYIGIQQLFPLLYR